MKMSKQEIARCFDIPDVDVVTALIDAINEAEKRAYRIRMSRLFNAPLQD